MKEAEMESIAAWIDQAIAAADDPDKLDSIRAAVTDFCAAFPAPGIVI
jgi:glycine/serine hydroxymethyltransferase